MKIRIAVFACLLLATTLHAANKRPERPPPIAAVRIRQVFRVLTPTGWIENTKVQSGAVIWRQPSGIGEILTCAHGLDENAPVHLLLSPTELAWGRIRAIDRDRDLALIHVKIPANITPLQMWTAAPDAGDAMVVGFGGGWWDNAYLERKTKISGIVDYNGQNFLKLSTAARNGDSGGPVISDGKIVGVHVRSDKRTFSLEVPVEDVHKFLVEKAGWKRE